MKKIIFSLMLLGTSATAFAGGFQLTEYSVTGVGRSFGGAGIVGDDYSALAFNPAGMTLKDSGVQVGANIVRIKADVSGNTSNGALHAGREGDINLRQWVPHFFGQYKANDKVRLGLGMYAPFGLSTIYNEDWFGRTHALKSKIKVMDINPSIAYQVSDSFSVGGGFILERLTAQLTNNLPDYLAPTIPLGGQLELKEKGKWEYVYNFGFMYEPVKGTRFGASYRSKANYHLKGDITILGSSSPLPFYRDGVTIGRTKLTLPEYIWLSAVHEWNDRWTSSASFKWVHWNRFKNLDIESSCFLGGVSKTPEHWKNALFLSLGTDYKYNDDLTFRWGVAYDQSPVKDAIYRTARIPDNDRIWASAGLSYIYKKAQFDLGYTHMFIHTARTHNYANGSRLNARYHLGTDILGAALQYHF